MANAVQKFLADFHFVRGMNNLNRGKLDQALAYFRRAIGQQPDNGMYYYNAAIALSMLGELDEAMRCFNNTVKLIPHHAEAYHNRGLLRVQMGDYDGGIEDITQALKLD